MNSKQSQEGWLYVDHRFTPGVSDDVQQAAGLPVGTGRGLFEAATITCSHCQTVVVKNPFRTRERAYCAKCDHYLCDNCGAIRAANGGECRSFKQLVEETQEQAALAEQRGSIILPT